MLLLPGWFLEYVVLGLGKHTVDNLATLIFSSGSTGDPKGVMLTHGNVAGNAESVIQETHVSAPDRLLGVLPLFHSFGYTVTLWTPLQVGASVVFHPDPRAAKEIGELSRKYHCTIYLSTATFLRFCLKKCDPADFRTIRILVCGAEKLPMALADEFEQKFGVRPLEGYGCTELSPVVSANLPDYEIDGLWQINNRPGSIGPPLPGVAAKVVHAETFEPLPVGEDGLVLIYGPNVMRGYLGRPEQTARVIRDGWYMTGDMGHLDADGCVTLTGRLSRFAKVGGEMVPLEARRGGVARDSQHDGARLRRDLRAGRGSRRTPGGAAHAGGGAGGETVVAAADRPRPAGIVDTVGARFLSSVGTAAIG